MSTARYLAKCPGCKKAVTRDFQTIGGNKLPVVPVSMGALYNHPTQNFDLITIWEAAEAGHLRCECGRALKSGRWKVLKATFKPQVTCGALCINASGPSCDCSCRGKNHGSNHL